MTVAKPVISDDLIDALMKVFCPRVRGNLPGGFRVKIQKMATS